MPKKIIFKEGSDNLIGNVPNGYRTVGFDGTTLSQKDSTQTITEIGGGGSSYLKYVALISQTGTNVPTAIVLENTLGATPSFTRYPGGGFTPDEGIFSVDLTGAFTVDKTVVYFTNSHGMSSGLVTVQMSGLPNNIYFYTYNLSGPVLQNGILDKATLEIRVYP